MCSFTNEQVWESINIKYSIMAFLNLFLLTEMLSFLPSCYPCPDRNLVAIPLFPWVWLLVWILHFEKLLSWRETHPLIPSSHPPFFFFRSKCLQEIGGHSWELGIGSRSPTGETGMPSATSSLLPPHCVLGQRWSLNPATMFLDTAYQARS